MKDTEVSLLLQQEAKRQESAVNLIASENYASLDVLEALGSTLTNKYAEGYPGARYYGGNAHIDSIEKLAQERALALFGLSADEWSVNVQSLSGSPAKAAGTLAEKVAKLPSLEVETRQLFWLSPNRLAAERLITTSSHKLAYKNSGHRHPFLHRLQANIRVAINHLRLDRLPF
ncbi:MAG: hypothetical protein V4478_01120 [Patescibacteria group bacterium]